MAKRKQTEGEASQSAHKRKRHVPKVIDGETGSLVPPIGRITRLKNVKSVRAELARIYRSARTGLIPPEVATKLAYVLRELRDTIEVADLEEQVADLRREIAVLSAGR